MVDPNSNEAELKILKQEYGVDPLALEDVLILTSADKLAERRKEFPNVRVEPINFNSTELQIRDWRFLMGVGGNQMYIRQINMIMRELRQDITLETLKERVSESDLTDQQKHIADLRLNFASQFIDDSRSLADMLRPGRLIIVDLRDEFIDKDEALGLFVVMLNIFANARRDEKFNKMIVFDEAHKYMDNTNLTDHIVDAIRQMRHQGVSILIASQDPPSLPNAIIELSSIVIMHRFNSPPWLKHIQKSITALSDITSHQMASLGQGEAFLWANKATERIFHKICTSALSSSCHATWWWNKNCSVKRAMSYKILHFSDLKLDKSFAGQGFPLEYGNERRLGLRATLSGILARARELKVDAVTIGGNLFVQELLLPETANFIRQQFALLSPTRVIIAPGEQDPYTNESPYAQLNWPDNVDIFYQSKLTDLKLADDIYLWGACNPLKHRADLLEDFRSFPGTHILLLHISEDSNRVETLGIRDTALKNAGFSLALMGGKDGSDIQPTNLPMLAYPGSPEPLQTDQNGNHYIILVEVDQGHISIQPLSLQQWIYQFMK